MSQSGQHTRQNSSSFQDKRSFDPLRKSVQFSSRIPKMSHDQTKTRAPSNSARASTGQTANIVTEPTSLNLQNISSQQPQINSARGVNHKTPLRHVSQIPSISTTTQFNYSYQSTTNSQQNSFSASKEAPTGRLSAEQKSQRLEGLMNSSFRKSQKVKSVDHSLLLQNSSRIKNGSTIPSVKVAELFRENQSLHSELTLVKLKIQSIENNQSRFIETLRGERRVQDQRIEELSIENTQMSQRIADLQALVHNLISSNPKLGTRIQLPVSASSSNKVSRKGTPTRFKTTSKQFTGLRSMEDMSKSSLTQEYLGSRMLSVIREREAEQKKSVLRRSIANSSSNVIETISEDQIGDTPREHSKVNGGNYRTQRFEMSPQDYRKAGAYFRSAEMPTLVCKFGGAGNMSSVQDSLDIQSEMNTSKQQQHLVQKLKKLNCSGIKPKHHLKRQSQNLADQTRNIQFKTQSNLTFRHQEEVPENLDVDETCMKKPSNGHFTESGVARVPQHKRTASRSLQSTLGERRFCICDGETNRISNKQIRQHRLSHGDDSLTLFDTTENDDSIMKSENYQSSCGKYCRNLLPKEQAKIIAEILRVENSSPLKMSKGNKQEFDSLQPRAERGQEGEKKYILSALWWNKWRDFVNLGSSDEAQEHRPRLTFEHTMVQDGEGQPDLRNSIDTMRAKLSGVHGVSQDYVKPSRINNSSLLDSKQFLKPGLLEHFDYVGVSQDVWRYLVAWYSCDWIIVRFLRKDMHSSTERKVRLYLEIYPEDPQPAQSARQKGHMRLATTGAGGGIGNSGRCEQSEERERLMKNLDRDAKLLAKKLRGSMSSFANKSKEEDLSYYLSGSPAQQYMNHENSLFLMHDMPQIDDPIPTLGSEEFRDIRRK